MAAWLAMAMIVAMVAVGPGRAVAAPAPPSCTGVMAQLRACAAYVAVSNPSAQPTSACCSSVSGVDPSCMCNIVNGPPVPNLDKNRALGLPQACNLPGFSADMCNSSG